MIDIRENVIGAGTVKIPVLNTGTTTIKAGQCIAYTGSTNMTISGALVTTANSTQVFAIAENDITPGYVGSAIVIRPIILAQCDGGSSGTAVGDILATAASGDLTTNNSATFAQAVGIALQAVPASTTATIMVMI